MKMFALYVVSGGTAAVVNFLSRMFYNHFLNFGISVILAYLTGMFVNFLLSKFLAFNAAGSRRSHRELLKFLLVTGFGLLATFVTSVAALRYLSAGLAAILSPADLMKVSHLVGIGCGFIVNFLGHKYFSFRHTGMWNKLAGVSPK